MIPIVRKITMIALIMVSLLWFTVGTIAQTVAPFDTQQARLNGLTLPEGTRYVLILPYNNADALYDLTVTVDLPAEAQLILAQETDTVRFNGVASNGTATQLFWRASEILSGDLFAPFAFTLAQPLTSFISVNLTWYDSFGEAQSSSLILEPNTLNAVGEGASFNPDAPIPAERFTFIGDTGVVIYTPQELPASAITVREMTPAENPPAEMGDFWWCSGLDLQGAGGVTVYVPLRRPLPPLMPLTLFAQEGGVWRILETQGYVSADGLYAVYDHPGGIVFTGTEAENQPAEAPPAPPSPPDSDGDGFTDDVDSCPNQGDAGFGLGGDGCPVPPPPPPPDSDGDGIPDPNDTCPNDGDFGFGLGGDGCPVPPPPPPPDTDGDGRPDNADSCPTEGDLGFGIDGDGCPNPPPPDTDGDGILDFADSCPTEGDLGFGLNDDGCPTSPPPPPLDTDGDGIPDDADTCPQQGDEGFGITADGCPLVPSVAPTSDIPAPTEAPTLTPTSTTAPLPTPTPAQLVRFEVPQFTVIFGNTAQAIVEIAEPAPADVRVLIEPLAGANNMRFTAPSEVTIPAGQTSVTFGIFPEENRNGFITLQATVLENLTSRVVANVLVQPLSLVAVAVTPTRFLPGQLGSGTVQMSAPTEFDTSIQLVSNNPDIILNPLVMPAGQTSVGFEFTVAPVVTNTQAQFTATFGDTAIFGTQSVRSAVLELKNQVNFEVILPATISTPGDYIGEIVLLDPVLPVSASFMLSSSNPNVVVASDVTLGAGLNRVPFTVSVADGGVFNEAVLINALELSTGTIIGGTFNLHTLRIQSVAFAEATLTTGLTSVARVTLNAPVPSGVAEVVISINNADVIPNLTAIDAEAGLYALQIGAGESTAQFDVSVASTVTEDTSVTLQGIFPADVSASNEAQVLGGVRIVSLDFGTQPIVPGRSAVGLIRINIPAPSNTNIRIVPLDTVAFAFLFPQSVTVFAGQTTANVPVNVFGNFSNPRVGLIAHLDTQVPGEGVVGFFDISTVQVASISLTSPVLASDTPSSAIVRLTGALPGDSRVSIIAINPDGTTSNVVQSTNSLIPAGTTEITVPLTLNERNFPLGVITDTLSLRLSASLGVTIGGAGIIPVETILQVRPSLIPDSISPFSQSVFASNPTVPDLTVRLRGATSTTGGQLRITSSHPEFVIPLQEVIEVPANRGSVSVPLKVISDQFGDIFQDITFTVTNLNGSNPKTVVIRFVRANLTSFTTSEQNDFRGIPTRIGRVTSNTNFTVTCGNPCYLRFGTNNVFTSNRTEPPGNNISTEINLGFRFRYGAFSSSETLSTTLTAQTGGVSRTATVTTSPTSIVNANISTLQNPAGQAYLAGGASLSGSIDSNITIRLESSLPSVIPPTFYNFENNDCNTAGAGGTGRNLSSFSGISTAWCMDVRESAVSVPTSVTITVTATSGEFGLTYTSRKSFTVVVSPAGAVGTPTPTRTPIALIGVATPIAAIQNLGQNVVINIATATPAPTNTPLPPIVTPFVPLLQANFTVPLATPAPVTLSISANTTSRRATISISSTRTTDLVINLSSSNGSIIGVPSTVVIPRGSRSVSFDYTVNTLFVRVSPTTVRISASGGGGSTSVSISVRR